MLPVQLDVTDRAAWVRAVVQVEEGLGPIDVLVNNAGIGLTGMMRDMTYKDWDFAMEVNFGGVLNGLMTALPRMLARETGAVLGGTVYSDALSAPNGPAGTYLDMLHHNTRLFVAAMGTA